MLDLSKSITPNKMETRFSKRKSLRLIPLFLILLVIPMVASQEEEASFQYNKGFDLKRACFDTGKFCDTGFECNITLIYPDGTTLIDNQVLTNQVSFRNITISQEQNYQLGFIQAIESCTNGTSAGGETFRIAITADGKEFQKFPFQYFIIIIGFALIGVGLTSERFRIFQISGSILIFIMGIITLYPGYSFLNWSTLLGKAVGFTFIGLGAYFMIESSFSRERQQDWYAQ